jgi:hypothetical protein
MGKRPTAWQREAKEEITAFRSVIRNLREEIDELKMIRDGGAHGFRHGTQHVWFFLSLSLSLCVLLSFNLCES